MVELGKALLKSAEDGDTNEVKNLISRGAPMTADWLGMKANNKCTEKCINSKWKYVPKILHESANECAFVPQYESNAHLWIQSSVIEEEFIGRFKSVQWYKKECAWKSVC